MASLIDLLPPINEDDYNKWQADTVGRLMGRRIKSLDQPAPAPPQPDYSSYGQRPPESPPEPVPQPPQPDYMSYGQRPPEPAPEPPQPAPSFQEAAPYQDTQTQAAPPPPDTIAPYRPDVVEQASDAGSSFLDYANQKIASLGQSASDTGSSFLDYTNQKIASLGQPSTSPVSQPAAPPLPVAPTPDMTLAQPFQDAAARPFAEAPVPQAIAGAATAISDFVNPEYALQNQAFDQRLAGLPLTPEQAAAEQRQINAIAMGSGGPIKIIGGKVLGAIGGKALGAIGSKVGPEVVGAVEGKAARAVARARQVYERPQLVDSGQIVPPIEPPKLPPSTPLIEPPTGGSGAPPIKPPIEPPAPPLVTPPEPPIIPPVVPPTTIASALQAGQPPLLPPGGKPPVPPVPPGDTPPRPPTPPLQPSLPVEPSPGVVPLAVGAKSNSPVVKATMSMYSRVPSTAPLDKLSTVERLRRGWVRAWTDRGVDANVLEQEVTKRTGGNIAVDEMMAELQRLDPNKAAETWAQEMKPAIQRVGDDRGQLSAFMTFKHNVSVADAFGNNARLFSGGLTKARSEQGLVDLTTELGPARMAAVQQSADDMWTINRGLLQRRLDSGLIDQDLYNLLTTKYKYYSPTIILDYLDAEAKATSSNLPKSISVYENGIKRFTQEGTTKDQLDPLIATIQNIHSTEYAARKNDVFNAFVKLADRDPILAADVIKVAPGASHPARLKSVTGFVNGDKAEFLVTEPIRRAVEQEPLVHVPGVNPVMAMWQSMVTSKNVGFLAANAFNDAGTYMLRELARGNGDVRTVLPAMKELIRGYAEVMPGLLTGEYKGELARYFKSGGGMGGYTNITPQEGMSALGAMARKSVLEIKSPQDAKRILWDIARFKPVEAVSERIEAAPRVASMRLAERRGANQVESTIAGRTVTIDFAQGGTWAKAINQIVPFFNVGVQAGATVARTAQANPKGAAAVFAALVGPTLAAEAWNRSDEQRQRDYEDVPQYYKSQGIVLMVPGVAPVDTQSNPHPQFLFFRAREFSAPVLLARDIATKVIGKRPESWQELAGGLLQSVSPVQLDESGVSVSTPFDLANELRMNKDFYRGSMIDTDRNNVSASAISQGVSKLTGVSPSRVEYVTKELGGGPGQTLTEASNIIAGRPIPPNAAGPSALPLVGSAIKRGMRGEIGGQLQQAQNDYISPDARKAIADAGITYLPGLAGRTVDGVDLTVEEETNYQLALNDYVERAIWQTVDAPSFKHAQPSDQDTQVRSAVDAARAKAKAKLIGGIGQSTWAHRKRVAA